VRLAIGASRAQIVTQALVESVLLSVAGGVAGLLVAMGAARLLLSLAFTTSTFLPIDTTPSPSCSRSPSARPSSPASCSAPPGLVRDAHRSDRRAARLGTDDGRSLLAHAHGAPHRPGDALSRAGRRGDDARAQSEQRPESDFGYQIRDRVLVAMNRPPAGYTQPQLAAMYRSLEERLARLPASAGAAWRSTTRSPTTGAR
jgi:hypothetical protein